MSLNKKGSKQIALWFVLLIGFIPSQFLEQYRIFNLIYDVLKIICLIYVLLKADKIQINSLLITIIFSELSLIISTIRIGESIGNIRLALVNSFNVIIFCLFIQIMMKINAKNCIRVVYDICEVLIYLNVLSAIIFPNGLYKQSAFRHYYFLGHQNKMLIYSMIAFALGEIRTQIDSPNKYNKKRLYLVIIISVFYILRVWSATSIAGFGMMILLVVYDHFSKHGFRVPVIFSFLINFIILFLFVIGQRINIFSNIIKNVFHRSITLTGRTTIWAKAYDAFLSEPIFGWGSGFGEVIFGFDSSHNRYLSILYTQGIVGMIFFVILILIINYSLQNANKANYNCGKIMKIFFFCIFIVFQTETFNNYIFYAMLIIAFNINKLKTFCHQISFEISFTDLWQYLFQLDNSEISYYRRS